MRQRLDVVLVRLGLAETRERAHALILSGQIRVDGERATKPSRLIEEDVDVAVTNVSREYVSRGALKLEKALDVWQIDPTDKVVLDVGASTGGFTELLLERGARRVYAVDVGYGQLHYRLRGDPRVVVLERTNIRYLTELQERADLGVVDVSFISLKLALPPMFRLVDEQILALIKPQFEVGRGQVGKGGVVRDQAQRQGVISDLRRWADSQPWQLRDVIESPIKGPAGNVEFLGLWLPARA